MKHEPSHYAFIDAARGLAIMLVMAAHVSEQLTGNALGFLNFVGNSGVQLFFVVSAFTLMNSSSTRGLEKRADIARFYIRRLFRIAPLYWFGIILYALFGYLMTYIGMTERWAEYTLYNVIANMLLLHGLVPSANISIVHGGWSIGTEILFYLAFPLVYRYARGCSVSRIAIAFLLSILASVSLQAVMPFFDVRRVADEGFWFSSILNQFPVFVAGIFLFCIQQGRNSQVDYS